MENADYNDDNAYTVYTNKTRFDISCAMYYATYFNESWTFNK